MYKFLAIVRWTVWDSMNQRSFVVLLVTGLLFVLTLRGCYTGSYTVNGQQVQGLAVAWNVATAAFHIAAAAAMLVAALLGMGAMRRDRSDGSMIMILSRPVGRAACIFGRALGIWLVAAIFMASLHLAIFILTYLSAGGRMPGFAAASAICSLNLLFVSFAVVLFSLVMPDFIAAIAVAGISAISLASDSVQQALQNDTIRSIVTPHAPAAPALWRTLWPKLFAAQYWAASFIGESHARQPWPAHPVMNLLGYIALIAIILYWRFEREEM